MKMKIISILLAIIIVVAGLGIYLGYEISSGNPTDLPAMHITRCGLLNNEQTYQTGVIVSDMMDLGLPVTVKIVDATESGTWLSPNSTPRFVDCVWLPDWLDPIAQQMYPMTGYSNSGSFGANRAWATNETLNSSLALKIAFESNKILQYSLNTRKQKGKTHSCTSMIMSLRGHLPRQRSISQ